MNYKHVTLSLISLLAFSLEAKKNKCLNKACNISRLSVTDERVIAFMRRLATARKDTLCHRPSRIKSKINKAEKNIPCFAANFTKTLEHDYTTGLLTKCGRKNYRKLLKALALGNQNIFNSIVRASGKSAKLANPQGAFMFSLEGVDSALFTSIPFPELSSAQAAAYMIEDYLMALCRDVIFADYGTGQNTDADGKGGSLTITAAQVLQDLGRAYQGPRNSNGSIDTTVLFKGNSAGDLIGPYVSQFLLLPLKGLYPSGIGIGNINQAIVTESIQLRPIAQRREFGVSFRDFVDIQNGLVPKQYTAHDFDEVNKRYMVTGRDLANFTHYDSPYEEYYNAVNILASRGFPLSKALPYVNNSITNESSFVSMGVPDIYELIAGVSLEALKAAWAQKWRVGRALRPEAFSGLVQLVKITGKNPFNLYSSLFVPHSGIDVLELIRERNIMQASTVIDPQQLLSPAEAATYMLAQVYPEGSPTHPTCPAGHATIAGACVTVIKALYEDTTKFNSIIAPVGVDGVDPTQLIPLQDEGETNMTVGSELDKLASNIAFARNFAGVHYRSDAIGIELGEQVAIRYLQDRACIYNEPTFRGFELTKRNGTRIRITAQYVSIVA